MAKTRSHYERGEARKALLLDAAVTVIAEHGLEGVTHRAVARVADVPLSTTSYFFSSLDELIGAAVTRIADEVLREAESVAAQAADALTGLSVDSYLDQLLDIVTAPRERQVLVQFEAYLATTRRQDLVEPVLRIARAYEQAAATVFQALGAATPGRAGRQLIAVLDGFALQRLVDPQPDDLDMVREVVRKLADAHLGSPDLTEPTEPPSRPTVLAG